MVKIGDKVRFLDAQGGGIVRSFKTKDLAMVEDEDGFEIPTLVSQCVVVSDEDDERAAGHVRPKQAPPRRLGDAALRGSQPHSDPRLRPAAPAPEPERPRTWEDTRHAAPAAAAERAEGDVLNVELAFLPADVRRLSETDFECYLVNDSNYELSYTLLSGCDALATLRCAGRIEPNTKERLFLIRRADLEDLEHCAVQLIAYKRGRPFQAQSPMHVDLRLNTARFYKLHAFVENDFFDRGALLQPVVRGGRPYLPMLIDEKAVAAGIREKMAATRPPKASAPAAAPLGRPAGPAQSKPHQDPAKMQPVEVDLHIHALLDTTAGMDASDMLNYQLSVFHKTMREHQNERGRRLIFIHGKGEGVLRKALLDELRRFYPACEWQDASFQQYGFGATQVTVRHK